MNRNVTSVILIILAVGLYFTYTKGLIDDIKTIGTVNDQYNSALDNAKQLIAVRDKANEDWKNVSADDQAKLAKMLPSTVDNIRLIIDLNNMAASKFNLALQNVSASASGANSQKSNVPAPILQNSSVSIPTLPVKTLDTVAVSFSVSTTYEQFIAFLRELETNLRIMDVTHLSVSANNSGTYDFSIQLNTYWLRQ